MACHPFKAQLNIAGQFAYQFIHSKMTLLLILISIILGSLALLFTPKTYNPEIIVPAVNIFVSRPGSDASEILHQIVQPLEALMATIPGVDHTYGMATNDRGLVTVRFKVNENEEASLVKVYNQINSNADHIPSGTSSPLIQSVSLYDVPLVTITLSSLYKNDISLRKTALLLLEKLRSVPQVGKSWIAGSSPKAVRVWLDPNKLATFALSLQNIKQALQGNNTGFSSGDIQFNNQKILLHVQAQLINPEDVGNIMVGTFNSKPVLLKDIASIETAPQDENIYSLFTTSNTTKLKKTGNTLETAVTIAITRQKGSNGVAVAHAILEKLNVIKTQLVPHDIHITITRNYGADANDAVNTLIEHLIISIGAVVIVLWAFLGFREAFIVMLSIPLILFIVLGIGWISGQTINRITLFALILSLGLLVDDSIVVIENIHRHMKIQRLRNFGKLVVNAANEIGKPTIVATFTVILALVPMAFVGGMMGPFMRPIPFNAPLAMLVSLLIAYTVVPYLAYRWLKHKRDKNINLEKESHSSHHSWLHNAYLALFRPMVTSVRKRQIFYGSVIVLLLVVMLQPLWSFIRPGGPNGPLSFLGVELKMLPDDNVDTFLVEIDAPTGTTSKLTEQAARAITDLLIQNQYVKNIQIFMAKAAPIDFAAMARGDALNYGTHYAQLRINLISKHQRSIGSHAIAQEIYPQLIKINQNFPSFHFKLFETPPGPPVKAQLESALYGPNYEKLRYLADSISHNIYTKIYGISNIDNSVSADLPEYNILINRDIATLAGLAPSSVADDIKTFFAGLSIGSIHDETAREPIDIILRLPQLSRANAKIFNSLYFNNRQNDMIPLEKFASIEQVLHEKPIFTRDQQEVVYITGDILSSSPVNAVISINSLLKNHPIASQLIKIGNLGFMPSLPENISHYQLFWEGEMRLTLDVFRDLGSAFIVAIIFIYILLVGFYRSFFTPLIIMGAIPLTIIGVFPGHWLMHQPFTATSMIGVIALAGIVVRNSLLLIDFIIEKQKQGFSVENAILEAGVARLLPILLTAFAIILGSAIMLSDPVFGGLAISLIFGAFASTILTLFVIPLIYYDWWQKRFRI